MSELNAALEHPVYNYKVVRQFAVMTVVWGIVGMLVGVYIAAELVWPALNLNLPWTSFGRLRPLHTNAVIFAFGGNAMFAGIYYIVQRLLPDADVSATSSPRTFWGWQGSSCRGGLPAAGVHHLQGVRRARVAHRHRHHGRLGHLRHRVLRHASSSARPATSTSRTGSSSRSSSPWRCCTSSTALAHSGLGDQELLGLRGQRQDAMVQWWYGHNAVGFFLTAGFLGMMYYFVPKQAERPVYSYRLSIVHFWALVAVYIWAGPHHLHYTALPDWAQSLGMVMSIILLAPSWGGMINGIMTLSGAWHKLRTDPILRFMVVSLSFYGMSTFEGPMMSIKTVNSLSHYTDWTIGHVHSGALGWVAMISIGCLYHLIPKVYGKERMYSTDLINVHFWMSTIGTVLYIAALWVNGIMQGLMWRAYNQDGTLTYAFVESVVASYPGWIVRVLGGAIFLGGMLIMAYNVFMTIRSEEPAQAPAPAAA
jgi:cytochrome c oxidase cbb3-type subunit 1